MKNNKNLRITHNALMVVVVFLLFCGCTSDDYVEAIDTVTSDSVLSTYEEEYWEW